MLTVSELLLLHSQQKARLTRSISVVFFWSVHFSASFPSFLFCFSLLHSCFCCTNRSLACISDGSQALDCIKAVTTSAAACPLRGANFDLFRELYFCLCRELSVLKAFISSSAILGVLLFLLFRHLLRMFSFFIVIFLIIFFTYSFRTNLKWVSLCVPWVVKLLETGVLHTSITC